MGVVEGFTPDVLGDVPGIWNVSGSGGPHHVIPRVWVVRRTDVELWSCTGQRVISSLPVKETIEEVIYLDYPCTGHSPGRDLLPYTLVYSV